LYMHFLHALPTYVRCVNKSCVQSPLWPYGYFLHTSSFLLLLLWSEICIPAFRNIHSETIQCHLLIHLHFSGVTVEVLMFVSVKCHLCTAHVCSLFIELLVQESYSNRKLVLWKHNSCIVSHCLGSACI